MAKGDAQRAQNMINRQEVTGQNALNRMGSNFYDANRTFGANYAMGSGMNLNSYDDIMRNYSSMFQNPFNPQTTISFSIRNSGFVKIRLYDSLGKLVKIIVAGNYNPGKYNLNINMEGHISGIYFYSFEYNDKKEVKKMLYIK